MSLKNEIQQLIKDSFCFSVKQKTNQKIFLKQYFFPFYYKGKPTTINEVHVVGPS